MEMVDPIQLLKVIKSHNVRRIDGHFLIDFSEHKKLKEQDEIRMSK